jgi:maleylpyruvate isomerase
MVSRRHIIAHIGYHARLLSEIVGWVRSNRDGHLPFGAEVDSEDVRQQVTLPARALRNLFVHSGVHLDVEWRDLSDAQWHMSVQDRSGQPIAIQETPGRRARAIWLHAMDLGAGGRYDDIPPELLGSLIRDVAERKSQTADGPFFITDRGKSVTISNDAGITVSGTAGEVVRWLYGRGAARNLQYSGCALPNDLTLLPNLIGVRPNPLDFRSPLKF